METIKGVGRLMSEIHTQNLEAPQHISTIDFSKLPFCPLTNFTDTPDTVPQIGPLQPWMDIPHIQTRSITFGWWPLSIYVELPSMNYSNHHFCPHHCLCSSSFTSSQYLLPSEPSHLQATSSAHLHKTIHHVCMSKGLQPDPVVPINLVTRCGMWWNLRQ